jgi:aminoglycoside phosphotransferase (APT) family kinase protein
MAAHPRPAPADTADAGTVPGIDVPRVTEWFEQHIGGATGPLEFTLIAGGRSNPTFRVVDAGGRAYALRRPPVSHVLPTAHDMTREHRLISALGPAGIPVPKALGLCTDDEVNGRPFYVMEFVEGHILRDRPAAEREFDEDTRAAIGPNMAHTLAALHAVDVDAVGLGDLARRDGYVERQLKRWSGQYAQMAVEGVDHGGIVERVAADLAATVPEQRAVSVVHGDYRLDNMVLADDGSVRAILDWEICTLGDPLADVGLLLVYWTEADDELPVLGVAPTLAPGFSSRADLLDTYADASGRDVADVPYFMAFGYWKLACILQGVYARYVGGAGSGDSGSVDEFPRHVQRLAQAAADTLAGRPPR